MTTAEEKAELFMQRAEDKLGMNIGPKIREVLLEEMQVTLITSLDEQHREITKSIAEAFTPDETVTMIAGELINELQRADDTHGPMCCLPGALMIIQEEFEELKDEVKMREPNPDMIEEEAVQLGAMCIKLIRYIRTDGGEVKEHESFGEEVAGAIKEATDEDTP